MTRTAIISAIALTFAAPAFASDADDIVDLGQTSPAAVADEHNADSDFTADENLGATSPAVIDEAEDTISTMSVEERKRLEDLGKTSPAELAD